MSEYIKIKRGLNIKMVGEAGKTIANLPLADTFALKPPNFIGVTPALCVQQGDEVKAGTALFTDKNEQAIKLCSPVSGEVAEIVRGEKRKILEIVILADKEIEYVDFPKANPSDLAKEEIIEELLNSGTWPLIRQRPFGIIANPKIIPKSIFISAFDSNPLAPDYDFIMQGNDPAFQTGLDALGKLTGGILHLNVKADTAPASIFLNAKGVQVNKVAGPHPAGNVGVQIHHIDPVNKGEVVWCINPQDILIIGNVFMKGKFEAWRTVAVTGSQVKNPRYYKTLIGASVKNMVADAGLKEGLSRIISGNVLTGKQITGEGFLDFYDSQLTVIPEGHEPEFMGWLKPGFGKMSMSRTFFSWLTPQKKHDLSTNMHGEERPFVVTGEYEKVLPMDIYPVYLLKSILVEDLEMMENLGIYEVVEEDFALCEFICTSKIESQDIIRKGLDLIRKELG